MNHKRVIGSLTSLRFFAAFAIVLLHTRGIIFDKDFLVGVRLDAGVTFFFVLSGFILAHAHSAKEVKSGLAEFYILRFARVWPAHAVTFALLLILLPSAAWTFDNGHPWTTGFLSLFLLNVWVPISSYYFSFNGVSWSIGVELFFYLMFPFLIINLERTWRWKLAFLLVTGFSVALVADLYSIPFLPSDPNAVVSHGMVYINPICRIQEFFIGILYYKIFSWSNKTNSFGFAQSTLLELCVLAFSVLAMMTLPSFLQDRLQDGFMALSRYLTQIGYAVVFGILLLVFASNKGGISKALSVRPLIFLGEISFSMYLVHPVAYRFFAYFLNLADGMPRIYVFSAIFLVILIVSYGMWRFVEVPCHWYVKRRLSEGLLNKAVKKTTV